VAQVVRLEILVLKEPKGTLAPLARNQLQLALKVQVDQAAPKDSEVHKATEVLKAQLELMDRVVRVVQVVQVLKVLRVLLDQAGLA
jgi:hypothetical protein